MAKRKKAKPAGDPEFAAYIAEQERLRHEVFLARQSDGHVDGLDAEFRASTEGVGPAPASVLHTHDPACFGDTSPSKRPLGRASVAWMVWCEPTAAWVPIRLALGNEPDHWDDAEQKRISAGESAALAEATWWTRLGAASGQS